MTSIIKRLYGKSLNYLYKASFITAVSHFVVSIILFFTFCITYSLLKFPDNLGTDKEIFITNFKKYFILGSGVAFLLPAILSLMLTIGLIKGKSIIVKIWVIASLIIYLCIITGLLGSGIYLVIEGALDIGITAIVLSVLIIALILHSTLYVIFYLKAYQKVSHKNEAKS
ncbi:hypothetical protein FQA39_LY14482 [Lamprigera yunnana]|nr:hypothetical protein FQA39_LY14482 [Lamprigera yunnana]